MVASRRFPGLPPWAKQDGRSAAESPNCISTLQSFRPRRRMSRPPFAFPGLEAVAVARPFWFTKLLVQSGLARFLPIARRLTDGGADYLKYYSDAVLAAPVEEMLDAA